MTCALDPLQVNRQSLIPFSTPEAAPAGRPPPHHPPPLTGVVHAQPPPQHLAHAQHLRQLPVRAPQPRERAVAEGVDLRLLGGGGEVQGLQAVGERVAAALGEDEDDGGEELPGAGEVDGWAGGGRAGWRAA